MTTLKGGISNTVYIWHSSKDACEKCQSLDGQEFNSIDEIPDRPHPNCKCTIEERIDDLCDCGELYDKLEEITSDLHVLAYETENEISDSENLISLADNVVAETENEINKIQEEVGKHLPECEYNVDVYYGEITATKDRLLTLRNDIFGTVAFLHTILLTTYTFIQNFLELLQEKDGTMDKYYHSVANCQGAQRGILGSAVAEGLSNSKELWDKFWHAQANKHLSEGELKEELLKKLKDNEADQTANRLGRERGRQYPYCDCHILMWDQIPTDKKEKHKNGNIINNL